MMCSHRVKVTVKDVTGDTHTVHTGENNVHKDESSTHSFFEMHMHGQPFYNGNVCMRTAPVCLNVCFAVCQSTLCIHAYLSAEQ